MAELEHVGARIAPVAAGWGPDATITHVAVVVPARDEADRISATIRSLDVARRRLPASVLSTIVVVADTCADDTEAVARRWLRTGDAVARVRVGNVGAARRVGSAVALGLIGRHPRGVWIASTDADTVVPAEWLVDQLRAAADGVEAVAGTVTLTDDADDVVRRRFARHYGTATSGEHPHVHACNLGVRGDAYVRAGGWAALATGEDHDLWGRLRGCARTRSMAELTVATSGRRRGRAPDGFAVDMDELAAAAG